MPQIVKIAIVDDHALFRKGLANLILSFSSNYTIFIEAENGFDLLEKIKTQGLPDILIMDMSMPNMDGFELVKQLQKDFSKIPILVVSMIHQESSIIRMLRIGVKGYVSKDIEPDELHKAIDTVINGNYHYTDFITGKLIQAIQSEYKHGFINDTILSEREITFLKYASSDDTYQQIANKMFLSIKTIDGYRAALFEKLQVKSRTGLVLYAVKNGLITT